MRAFLEELTMDRKAASEIAGDIARSVLWKLVKDERE